MRLSLDQKKVLSEFLANLGVAWFAGGIVAPIFTVKNMNEIILPGIWGLLMATLAVGSSLIIIKKK